MLKEDLILLNIQNKAIKVYKENVHPVVQSKTSYEHLRVLPHYINLKIFMRVFHILKPAITNMIDNICFLDIHEKYENIKIACDWCSICNGVFETVKQNINDNPGLIKEIDIQKIKFFDKYLDFVLNYRTKKISDSEIEEWCNNTFRKKTNDLLLLSRIYLKLELIELRWCPFKRSKEFYYRNKDHRYILPTEKVFHKMGKILSEHETITCSNCPKIINDNWKYTKSNKKSIFQPLLDYMTEEINKHA
jgi:hypothetical protein